MADHAHFPNKELYVYFSTPVKPREEVAKMMSKHLEYQVTLERKGVMFGASPMFQKGTDAPHRGMIIVQANSLEEAEEIAAADPMHTSGMREYIPERWHMNEGGVTLRVTFSDQAANTI